MLKLSINSITDEVDGCLLRESQRRQNQTVIDVSHHAYSPVLLVVFLSFV
jgi:hypothetical protein